MSIANHDFDREDAIRILGHYLRTAHEAADHEWTGDNHGDVIAIVDAIIRSAKRDS
jgi:hypothetical protein